MPPFFVATRGGACKAGSMMAVMAVMAVIVVIVVMVVMLMVREVAVKRT
jgi:glycerol-3-phosphate acyltransferase PlsY